MRCFKSFCRPAKPRASYDRSSGIASVVFSIVLTLRVTALSLSPGDAVLSQVERKRLLALGADVERARNSPGATPATRKRIIRTVVEEIVVRVRG